MFVLMYYELGRKYDEGTFEVSATSKVLLAKSSYFSFSSLLAIQDNPAFLRS